MAAATALMIASCSTSQQGERIEAAAARSARQDDNRSLEEKVDTDGDGEMSDDEIETYARATVLEFSQCMRDNGYPDFTDVVLEDFTENEGGQGAFLALMAERGVSLSDPDAIPTLTLCGSALSELRTFAPQPSDDEVAEREANVLAFATCMRGEGLTDWPDPDFAANGGNGYGPEILQQFDLESAEVQDAIATCQAENASVTLDQDSGENDDGPAREPADTGDESGSGGPAVDESGERSAISPLIEGDTSDLNVAEVLRRDLIQTKSLAGSLGYGDERTLPTNTTGIVTGLPEEGAIIGFGEALFYVDNEPVVLFEGDLPQYRPFTINMDDGADVQQLEQNLADHGYADGLDLTIDDDFTRTTRDAVEALQAEFGVEDTGRLELGRVVFASAPVRIGAVNVELGQSISPQIAVLGVTESDQRITLDLDAEDRSLVTAGTKVVIELPDGSTAAGEVLTVASIATRAINPQTGAPNDPTIDVTVVFSDTPPDGVFDAAPVDIIVTEEVTTGVLTVPVPALIALSGGGHGVELIVEGGTQLIEVELGEFVDDIVEVRGDLREGDRVVLAVAG